MGVWGLGNLENDDAADWLGDLADGDSADPVAAALTAVIDADYVESPTAGEALAAAEVVAAAKGQPPTGEGAEQVSELAKRWPETAEQAGRARQAVGAVLPIETSELAELFVEAGETEGWRAVVADLQQRLA